MSGGAGIIAALGAAGFGWTNAQTFFWGAVAAFAVGSYLVWADERKKAVSLENTANREAVRKVLADLRSDGVKLRNKVQFGIETPDEAGKWLVDISAWNTQVIAEIEKINAADAGWFSVLDVVPAPRLPFKPTGQEGEHDIDVHFQYSWHDFRLVKLEQLILKYGNVAA